MKALNFVWQGCFFFYYYLTTLTTNWAQSIFEILLKIPRGNVHAGRYTIWETLLSVMLLRFKFWGIKSDIFFHNRNTWKWKCCSKCFILSAHIVKSVFYCHTFSELLPLYRPFKHKIPSLVELSSCSGVSCNLSETPLGESNLLTYFCGFLINEGILEEIITGWLPPLPSLFVSLR